MAQRPLNELIRERLRGITAVSILIEELDDADAQCGISAGALNSEVTKALLDNDIRIASDDDYAVPALNVNVNSIHFDSDNLCVTNVDVALYKNLYTVTDHNQEPVFGRFDLAGNGVMLSSGIRDHGQRIKDAVFDYVEEIALAIL